MQPRHAVLTGIIAAAVCCLACSGPARDDPRARGGAWVQGTRLEMPAPGDLAPRHYPGIHNAVAYHEGFISGSAPEGDAGFDTLAAMGVRTIISVDGAPPDVEEARARGMRYIHLPIGYNGFDERRKAELVRATRDSLQGGPVYIHCHHGKHRSAGAAAAVGASLGWMTPEEAVARMKVSGTAPGYQGLYACAANSAVLEPGVIDAAPAEFPSVSRPTDFVGGMVETDEAMEHLKAIEKAGWRTPAEHPDLVPASEAGRVSELLRVMAEGGRARREPPEFARLLSEASQRAAALEESLASGVADPARLSSQFRLVAASCRDCHARFRD